VGQENNKAAHHIDVCSSTDARITHIGWACSNLAKVSASSLSARLKKDFNNEWEGIDGTSDPDELPRQITFLDIESALPKISPLPSASAGAGSVFIAIARSILATFDINELRSEDATVFTQRTSIEFLFQNVRPKDYDQVNVMIVGTNDSKIQLSIYDSFVIGSFQCPSWDASVSSQLIGHTSHPRVPTHSLIVAEKSTDSEEIYLVPMDIPFLSSSPINLSLLASKLTTLQKLLRYLRQTQLHMKVEWKNTRELPNRFLRSIQGDLEGADTGPRSIVSALYHTVVTGHAYEPVREWLVESLAERVSEVQPS
jgi:anaphase-promoting complex subunit 4